MRVAKQVFLWSVLILSQCAWPLTVDAEQRPITQAAASEHVHQLQRRLDDLISLVENVPIRSLKGYQGKFLPIVEEADELSDQLEKKLDMKKPLNRMKPTEFAWACLDQSARDVSNTAQQVEQTVGQFAGDRPDSKDLFVKIVEDTRRDFSTRTPGCPRT